MPLRFFTVSVRDGGAAERELNSFLQSHRVLAVDRRWVDQGADSFWSICIDFMEAGPSSASAGGRFGTGQRGKVDYKELLSPEDFTVFAELRDLRKQLAQTAAVPVYTIFTNEQLAQIVKQRAATKAALEQIAGVGGERVEKFGPPVLELVARHWKNGNEADGKPV